MSTEHLPSNLRCPECAAAFRFTASPHQPLPDSTFGVLSCGEHTYPVVDGIPILRSGRIDVQDHLTGQAHVTGPTVDELLGWLRTDPLEALVALLAFPPSLPFGLEHLPGLRLPLTQGPGAWLAARNRRRLVRRMLGRLGEQCAQDWLDLCYLRSRNVDRELHPYFLNRFGQPRYLASLSLTSIIDQDALPLLDVACGFGHVMHHLATRERPLRSVGVDRNFFQLWVARRFIVPGGHYVCADATRRLPFEDNSFCVSLCTDSFHLFEDKQTSLAEMRRCARDGTVIIDRVGNRVIEPHDGPFEFDPAGYTGLIDGAEYRIVGQTELVQGYLDGTRPQLAEQRNVGELTEKEKWISLVIADSTTLFKDFGPFERLPHGEGPLRLNPIYRTKLAAGGRKLVFEFPSTWYAFENAESLRYHATGVSLSDDEFEAAQEGRRTSRTDDLVKKYVMLGMPERYARPAHTDDDNRS